MVWDWISRHAAAVTASATVLTVVVATAGILVTVSQASRAGDEADRAERLVLLAKQEADEAARASAATERAAQSALRVADAAESQAKFANDQIALVERQTKASERAAAAAEGVLIQVGSRSAVTAPPGNASGPSGSRNGVIAGERRQTLMALRKRYIMQFGAVPSPTYFPPATWLNGELEREGYSWRVRRVQGNSAVTTDGQPLP